MKRTYIKDTPKQIDKEVKIFGWVDVRRDHGKLIFLDVRDMTGLVQVVINPQVSKTAHKEAKQVRGEYAVELDGKVKKRDEKLVNQTFSTGEVEIEVNTLKILAKAAPLPFELDSSLNLDTYLDHQPLALRSQKNRAVFKIQAAIVQSFHSFMQSQGFTEFQAPKIVAQAAEGGADVFKVDYFGRLAYLAQSPQLYKQIMVGVFERVYTVTSVYRAEPHSTTRHINEYVSLDYEMGFIQDHTDVMKLHRDWIEHLLEHLLKTTDKEFKILDASIPHAPKKIPSFKLIEAQEILEKEFKVTALGQPDLDPEHEKLICQYAKDNLDSEFVFVTHYPTSKRPFYTYPDEEDPEYTKSFDLLFRGVEITTGGQRIHDYKKLLDNIKKWGYQKENFSFYLEAFQYGMPPEGGCATGLERLTQKLTGLNNIRQATLFPRDLNRIDLALNDLQLDDEGGEQNGQKT